MHVRESNEPVANMTPVVTNGLAIWSSVTCHTAAMQAIALSQRVGVEVIFRLAASQLAALLYAVPARAAPHANLGHANNNTVSQSTTRQLHDFFVTPIYNIAPSLVDSGVPRLKNRLRIDPDNSCYIGTARLAVERNVIFLSGLSGNVSSSADKPAGASQSQRGACWGMWVTQIPSFVGMLDITHTHMHTQNSVHKAH